MNSVRIHIIGGDQWALGTEYRLAKQCLEQFAEIVDDPEKADFFHTVDVEDCASRIYNGAFRPEVPIVGAINNHPSRIVEWPGFVETAHKYMYLVPQSSLAAADMDRLGLEYPGKARIISDAASYYPVSKSNPDLKAFRNEIGIPEDRYIIGLLQRDSEGRDLCVAKRQKGPDIFLALMVALLSQVGPDRFHVLLGGPRRHWLKNKLQQYGVPYTFVGKPIEGDDYPANILDKPTMCLLYNLLDLYVIPTRWEGAPRQVFDVLECGKKIISTPVGIVPDILSPATIFSSVDHGVRLIRRDMEENFLQEFCGPQQQVVRTRHSIEAVGKLWKEVYHSIISREKVRPLCRYVSQKKWWGKPIQRFGAKCINAATRYSDHLYRLIRPRRVFFYSTGYEQLFLKSLKKEVAEHVQVVSAHEDSDVIVAGGDLAVLDPKTIRGKKCILLLDEMCLQRFTNEPAEKKKRFGEFCKLASTTVLASHNMLNKASAFGFALNNPVVVPTWVYGLEYPMKKDPRLNVLLVVDSLEQRKKYELSPESQTLQYTTLKATDIESQRGDCVTVMFDFYCAVVLLCSKMEPIFFRGLAEAGLPCVYPQEMKSWRNSLGFHGIPFANKDDLGTAVRWSVNNHHVFSELLTNPYREDVLNTLISIINH